MGLRAVLPLVTYPDANSSEVVANAIAVVRHLGATLHALAFNVDIPAVSNALSKLLLDLPGMIREAETQSRDHGKQLLAAVARRAKEAGIDLSTQEVTAAPALLGEAAALNSRYFDLSLIGCEPGNPTSRMVAEAVIFGSGRPTVLLPGHDCTHAIEHVAIAWDASRVAARAVADARPFLGIARRISIMTVLDEKPLAEKDIGERLAESLRKSGLPAEARTIEANGRAIGAALQEHAIDAGANLLVMGGYGHSRVRDFVLGGATEGILADLRLPALLSH